MAGQKIITEGNSSFLLYTNEFYPDVQWALSPLHVHTVYLTLFVSHNAFILFNGAPDNRQAFFFSFIKLSHNGREPLNEPSLEGKQARTITRTRAGPLGMR